MIEGIEDLLWTRPDGDVFGKVDPTNDSAGIDQKLGGSCDIRAFWPCPAMQHIVTANHFGFSIGK